MKKRLSYLLILCVALISSLASCTATDNLGGDFYTQNIYPGGATYDLGSPIFEWEDGYFHNIHISNILTLDGIDYTSANISGGGVTSFNARVGAVLPLVADYSAFYEPIIVPGLITDYWRGDKSWQPFPALTGFIPYVGATDNVNLNGKYITNAILDSVTANGTWTASGTWKLPAMFFNGDITTDRWLSSTTNTFLGVDVAGAGNLAHTGGSEGWDNTGIGNSALQAITTGYFNTAVGTLALSSITTGYFNSAFGTGTLLNLKDGFFNTGIGLEALAAEVSGNSNTALGMFAGYTTTGSGNVFLGFSAGKNELGSNTLYIDNSDTATPLISGNFTSNNVTINGVLDLATHQIRYVVDPTLAQDVATKNYVDTHAGVTTFLALTDTPASYVGQTDKVLVGNATEDGLVFADPIPKATSWNGTFTWNTTSYTTAETDVSSLFSTNLTGTTRRKYSVYLDLTGIEADASFVSLYMSVQTKINGVNYRAIDRKTVLDADIASNAEPGIVIMIPSVNQDTKITIQMTTATSANITIPYTVVKEHLE